MDVVELTAWERHRLECQLHETTDARVYRRTLAILEVGRGVPIAEVARMLGVTRQSIYAWVEHYLRTQDPSALIDAPRPGRPSVWQNPLRSLIRFLMETPPQELGYWATTWTVPLLQACLEQSTHRRLSEDSIRRELARQGYVWKRSRYVLKPDPDAEKKTPYSPENPAVATPKRGVGSR